MAASAIHHSHHSIIFLLLLAMIQTISKSVWCVTHGRSIQSVSTSQMKSERTYGTEIVKKKTKTTKMSKESHAQSHTIQYRIWKQTYNSSRSSSISVCWSRAHSSHAHYFPLTMCSAGRRNGPPRRESFDYNSMVHLQIRIFPFECTTMTSNNVIFRIRHIL